ncbi:MAG: glycosyltransferase family 4 protein, partial [Chloroflexota bacterium]
MRIALVAPVAESVPPAEYGGTERVVACLADELANRGHDVTLFASGDSHTAARLVPVVPQSVRHNNHDHDQLPAILLGLGMAYERAEEFDVIHAHVEHMALPFSRLAHTPSISTFHGRLDLLRFQPVFSYYREANLVSISDNQRRPVPYGNWVATVYNGIDLGLYTLERRSGNYLAFVGRIAPEKGVDVAIEVAKRTGVPLRIAAKVDDADRVYYETEIKPLMDHPLITYLGEVGDEEKNALMGRALALLFPIRWPEPFGLVMAEAMATGTPVIASRFGSVQEVVEHGKTGFVCDSLEEM